MPADEGVERSAILLIALGEDYASEVLKHLGPKEVQKLGHAMAALKTVPRAKVEEVLSDFHKTATESAAVHVDTDAYVRSVLTKALGDDKAANLLTRPLNSLAKPRMRHEDAGNRNGYVRAIARCDS